MKHNKLSDVIGIAGIDDENLEKIISKCAQECWNRHYQEHKNYKVILVDCVLRVFQINQDGSEKVIPFDFSVGFTSDFQFIVKKSISDFKQQLEYDYFIDKVGQIVTCTYKTKTRGNRGIVAIVRELNLSTLREGVTGRALIDKLPFSEMKILKDSDFEQSNREFYGLLYKVQRSSELQLHVDRLTNEFVLQLLKSVDIIPEIGQSVNIKSIARDYGLCYIIVQGFGVDPLKVCIGSHASRCKAISNMLGGDKVIFLEWNDSFKSFIAGMFKAQKVLEKDVIIENGNCYIITENKGEVIGREARTIRLCRKLLLPFYLDEQLNFIQTKTDLPVSSLRFSAVTREEYEDISVKNVKKLVNDIIAVCEISDYDDDKLLRSLIAHSGKIENVLIDPFTEDDMRLLLQKYFDIKIKPSLLKSYEESGGDGNFFMRVSGIPSTVYFDLLNNYGVKNQDDCKQLDVNEIVNHFKLDHEMCEILISGE